MRSAGRRTARGHLEIVIGAGSAADELIGPANLVQNPADSGKWRLSNEP